MVESFPVGAHVWVRKEPLVIGFRDDFSVITVPDAWEGRVVKIVDDYGRGVRDVHTGKVVTVDVSLLEAYEDEG
jgi:hypothetical protein